MAVDAAAGQLLFCIKKKQTPGLLKQQIKEFSPLAKSILYDSGIIKYRTCDFNPTII